MAARFETEIARLNEQINTLKEYIDALQETEEKESANAGREKAAHRRNKKQRQGNQQRLFAPVAVAERTDKELPGSQANHAESQTHLDKRRARPEILAQRRERRQVKISDERSEGREHPYEDQYVQS